MSLFTRFLLPALVAGALRPVAAQNVPFTVDKLPNKEVLKISLRAIKDGEEEIKASPPHYAAALAKYQTAQKYNANNAALNLRIGECHMNLGDLPTALPFLEKATELETGPTAPRTHYVLGRAYQLSARWAEALKEFERAKPVGAAAPKKGQPADATLAEVGRRLAECRSGQQLMAHPLRVFVDNLGPALNSPEDDHSPVITADEKALYFTSRRAGSAGSSKAADGRGYTEDVYSAQWSGSAWGAARNVNAPINTHGNDATVALSADGQRLLLHSENNADDLSESHLTATGWSKPKELGSHINTKYHETSATYSPDGKYVYFVSNKPEGSLGKRDIYKAEIEGKNPPVNLGATINTPYNEEGVFMAPDGKTLYFSSEGHSTMGGFDIFKSVFENGKWSTPENLGWPVNTPGDDVFFVASASGRYGYYASEQPNGLGGKDIYRITFLGSEKQPALSQEDRLLSGKAVATSRPQPVVKVPIVTPELTLLRGIVTDVASLQPVSAQLEIIDNASGQTVAMFQTTPAGKFLVSLPSGVNYGLVVRNEAYLFHSENFNLPPASGYAEVQKSIRLQKMEAGSNIVLRNIFFDPGKATLRPESTTELARLVKLMSDTPHLKLQVCGHTDEGGSAEANMGLSEHRAQAVAAYLIEHKIKPDRVKASGYGATIPLVANADVSETDRLANRRIEFKVLSR